MIVRCEYCGEEYDLSENGGVCPHCGGSYSNDNHNDNHYRDDDDVSIALMSFDESGIDKRVLTVEYDYLDKGAIDNGTEINVYYKYGYVPLSEKEKATLIYHIDEFRSYLIVNYSCPYYRYVIAGGKRNISWDEEERKNKGLSKEELKNICDADKLVFKYTTDGILHICNDSKGEFKLLAQVFYHALIDKSKYESSANQLAFIHFKNKSHGLEKALFLLVAMVLVSILLLIIL